MKLQITLTDERGQYGTIDEPGAMTTVWETCMDDCTVHAWFRVFESVLGAAGHNESLIMRGACQLAFNDCRDLQTMKTIAKEYDLTNWDD